VTACERAGARGRLDPSAAPARVFRRPRSSTEIVRHHYTQAGFPLCPETRCLSSTEARPL
jgi:hypothetical protein